MATRNRYYRILEKAKLEGDLFGDAPGRAAEPAFPAVENPQPIEETSPETQPAEQQPQPQAVGTLPDPDPEPEPVPEPESSPSVWRQELASTLSLEGLETVDSLVLCPVGGVRSAAETAVALGRWAADRAQRPLLIVEAAFESPQLARLFRTRRLGLSEALASHNPRWDNFVHDSPHPNLKILPAGRDPSIRNLAKQGDAFRSALQELSGLYEGVIVIAPHPRVRTFAPLLTVVADAVVFPVIQPGRTTAGQAARAVRSLKAASARVGVALAAPDRTAVEELRRGANQHRLGGPRA